MNLALLVSSSSSLVDLIHSFTIQLFSHKKKNFGGWQRVVGQDEGNKNHFIIWAGGTFPWRKTEAVAKETEDPIKSSWNWDKTLGDRAAFTYQDKLRVIPTHLYDWGACMPSHIFHCSSSRSLDRHNKLQCNKTKVQTNAGYQETNALHTLFCTVEYTSKHPPALHAPTSHATTNFLWKATQGTYTWTSCAPGAMLWILLITSRLQAFPK